MGIDSSYKEFNVTDRSSKDRRSKEMLISYPAICFEIWDRRLLMKLIYADCKSSDIGRDDCRPKDVEYYISTEDMIIEQDSVHKLSLDDFTLCCDNRKYDRLDYNWNNCDCPSSESTNTTLDVGYEWKYVLNCKDY